MLSTIKQSNMDNKTIEISKIKPIYNQYIRNIESIDIFFNKLYIKAIEEDKSILITQKEYLLDVIRETFGEDNYEKLIKKIESKKKQKLELDDKSNSGETINESEEIVDKKENLKTETEIEESTTIPTEKYELFLYRLDKAPKIQSKNLEILSNSTFLMLNNYYEYLFADLLSFHFTNNNNIIEEKNISISLSELKNFTTIEEAYKDLLFKEIEKLLLDLNFEELKNYFKKLDVSLAENYINWNLINEIRERRHLIVHNNGIVNQKYLNKSNNLHNLKIGDSVNVDNDYLKTAIDETLYAGALLIINCWAKWDKEFSSDAVSEIVDLSFECLKKKKYHLVIRLCEYAEKEIKPRNEAEEIYFLNIKINHCIALKELSRTKDLNSKIGNIRFGTLTPIYKLAKSILIDDFKEAQNIFNQAIIVDNLIKDQYLDWPLFENLRNNDEIHKYCISQFCSN